MKKFNLLGYEIEADIDLENYAIIRNVYREIASGMCEGFGEFWQKNCKNIHDVIEVCPDYFEHVITFLVEQANARLVAREIYDVDANSFYEKYKRKYLNSSFFNDTVTKYESIMRTKNQSYASAKRDYEYNSTSSSRWSGGGFGLGGAISGAVKAGAMNFVGDMIAERNASRTYNKQVDQLDNYFARKFDELYTKQLYIDIENGIWKLCINGMYAYMDELEAHDQFDYPYLDRNKADIIYNNNKKHGKGDVFVKNMIECIQLYPFEEDYYITLYNMSSLDMNDARTIELMVKFFHVDDSFYKATYDMRIARGEAKCLQMIEDSKAATIIEKAAVVKRFLAEADYGCILYKKKIQNTIIQFVNDAVRVITEEVYQGSESFDINVNLETYCKKNKISKENKDNLLIVLKCSEIIKKYPFFGSFSETDMNLELDNSFFDFFASIEELYKLMDVEVQDTAPSVIKSLLRKNLAMQWEENANTVKTIESFAKIQNQFVELFASEEVTSKSQITKRKTKCSKLIEGEKVLKEKYDDILSKTDSINANVLEDFLNDVSIHIPDNIPSQVEREYKQIIVDVLTKDCESKSEIELFKLQKLLSSYKDQFLIKKAKEVKNVFLNKIASDCPIIKTKYDGRDYGIEIADDLKTKNITHTSAELKSKIDTFYKKLEKWNKLYTKSYKWYKDWTEQIVPHCGKNINPEDICAMHIECPDDLEMLEVIEPGEYGVVGFLFTREGLICLKDEMKTYLNYYELKGVVAFKDSDIFLIQKESDKQIYIAHARDKGEAKEIVDLIGNVVSYLYGLPKGDFDETQYEKQIKEVDKLIKDIEKKNIEQLELILNKLKRYPKSVAGTAIQMTQEFYNNKVGKIREEFEELIKDYTEKTETQLEGILTEIEKFPVGLTEEVEPQIKKVYEEKVNNRLTEEINTLIENYQDKDVEELKAISKKLKKYPKELTEEIQTQIDETCEVKAYNRLKEEFEELTSDYPEKTEAELADILSMVGKFPKELTKDIVPQIRNVYEDKYNSRLNEEIKELVKNYRELDINALKGILSKLRQKYNGVPLGNEFISIVSDRIQELINETIMSLGGEVKNLSYVELIEKYYSISEDKALEKSFREPCLEEVSKQTIQKGNEIVQTLHEVIKKDYRTQNGIMKKVEFLSEESFSTKDTSTPYIFEKLYKEGKVQWFERPIIRVRDAVSQAMHEKTGHDSLEGLIITSHQIVIKPEYSFDWQNIPIRLDTKFFIKKKWLGNELRVDNVKADFAFENEYEENSIVNFLNDTLDRIRQSDLLQMSVKPSVTQPAYTQQNVNVQVPETLVQPQVQPQMQAQPQPQPQMQAPPQPQPQPLSATQTGNQLSLMNMNVQRSFTDVASFVNRFPSTVTKSIIGNLNPKFSKKVKNAVKAYAFSAREEEIFALFDDTFLGSGKEGFVMTMQGMIIKTSYRDTFNCAYSDIKGIKIIYDESTKLTKIFVDTQYGLGYISGSTVEAENLANRINEIVKYLYGLEVVPYIVEKSSQATVN